MDPLSAHKLQQVEALCQRFAVRQLEVFGSATTAEFDSVRSDIDFVVDFESATGSSLFERYFGLKTALENLFSCPVDLVMVGAMRNPYFIESVNRSRRTVYASPLATAA